MCLKRKSWIFQPWLICREIVCCGHREKKKKGGKSRVRIKLVVPGEGVIELTLAGGNMSTTV